MFSVTITVDETNKNVPSFDDIKMVIEESINTPDNNHFGITDYEVVGIEL